MARKKLKAFKAPTKGMYSKVRKMKTSIKAPKAMSKMMPKMPKKMKMSKWKI